MGNLIDFVKVYDNIATDDECKILVNLFETYKRYHNKVDNSRRPKFTEMNLTGTLDKTEQIASEIHSRLLGAFRRLKKEYFETVISKAYDGTSFVPDVHGWEQFRIKKYVQKTDEFREHVDVGDAGSSKRYLAFLLYLNDGFTGGETEFTTCGLTVTPKSGRVVVFPPTWNFPHQGNKVKKGEKYILSTYLNYI